MADVITRMRVDSSEYDQKIKRAQQNLLSLEQQFRATKQSMNTLSKENVEYVKSIGNMETVSRTARGRLSELTSAFTELSMVYKRMTYEEKKGDSGVALSGSLEQLKARIGEAKTQLSDVTAELGETGHAGVDLNGVMDQLGGQLGINTGLIRGLSAGTIGATAAIGAMVTTTLAASKAFADYNRELSMRGQVTTVTTGLQGPSADRMTDAARSISDVYGTDFREVINAANTLMTQFGQTGDSAMQLIRDGMQGMIMGDGPKLLSMIQQYAPSFRDAGISASQLVAIIHNSEGGIFTDQNMNAIVMGIKNIRLMTNKTSEALGELGIDGQKMSQQLSDGSMTIFQALGQVSEAIERTGSGSQAAGEVMQYVFGRQGTVAGTKLGEAIATLNTNLEETKNQTGKLGKAYADLEGANERLNKAIRDCFEYDGWETMTTGLKTGLVTALAAVAEKMGEIKTFVTGIEVAGTNVFDVIRTSAINSLGPLGKMLNLLIDIKKAKGGIGSGGDAGAALSAVLPAAAGVQSSKPQKPEPPKPPKPEPPKPPKAEPMVEGGLKGVKDMGVESVRTTESMRELQAELSRRREALAEATNGADFRAAEQGIAQTKRRMGVQGAAVRMGVSTTEMLDITDGAGEAAEQLRQRIEDELKEHPIVVPVETGGAAELPEIGEETMKAWQNAASAVGSVGSALQSIEDPGAKVAGIIANAIATIAMTFAKSLEGTWTPWDWIAGAAAGTATMIATIAAIKSATAGSYAQGGIVPGNSYSGDRLTANVNSGELILNRSQQDAVAAQLEWARQDIRGDGGTGGAGGSGRPYVTGEEIWTGTNNYTKRSGRGEIVTTRTLQRLGLM